MTKLPLFRPGTTDEHAWRETVVRNNYFLPRRFSSDDIILDIGAHIGCFSLAAIARAAGRVWAFEADKVNYTLASFNLRQHNGRAILRHAAVWRSDVPVGCVYFGGYEMWQGKINTGGGDVLGSIDGESVPALAFDEVIDEVTEGGARRIRLVKLDCEGSEYPILLTSRRLHLVDEIAGEYHVVDGERWSRLRDDARIPGYTRYIGDHLRAHLELQGFTARLGHCHSSLGQFMAWRR